MGKTMRRSEHQVSLRTVSTDTNATLVHDIEKKINTAADG